MRKEENHDVEHTIRKRFAFIVHLTIAVLLVSCRAGEQVDVPERTVVSDEVTSASTAMSTVEPLPDLTMMAYAMSTAVELSPTPAATTATATVMPTMSLIPAATATPLPPLTGLQKEHNDREQVVINSLSTSVSIEAFRQTLGPNLFYRVSENGYAEHVFARPGYWVQVITDDGGTVVFYAVTSCDLDFRPTVYTAANPDRGAQLQVSTYKAISPTLGAYHVFISGATANSFVFEMGYGEAADGSLDLVWGWNDACPSRYGISTTRLERCYHNLDCDPQELDEWRDSNAVNTVGVGDVDVAIDNFQIGIDRVQVRVYPGGLERAASLPPQPSASLTWQEAEEERINALSTLVTVETFQRILGPHLFYRESDDGRYGEYSFARRGYWVQAVTDRDGAVIFFAVTSCDEGFSPMVKSTALPSSMGPGAIQLRVTTGEDFGISGGDQAYIGGGNPSGYQQVYLGNNDACAPGVDGSFNTMAVAWSWGADPRAFQIGVDGAWVGEHPDNQ